MTYSSHSVIFNVWIGRPAEKGTPTPPSIILFSRKYCRSIIIIIMDEIECRDGVIYCYTNPVNNKKYIGQTTSHGWDRRHKDHGILNTGTVVCRAFLKYGYNTFKLEILEQNIQTQHELNSREIFWIKELKTKIPFGYNMTEGGKGTRGYKHSEHTKKKLRDRLVGTTQSPETIANRSKALTGYKWPEERKIREHDALVARIKKIPPVMTDELKAKLRETHVMPVVCVEFNKYFTSIKEAASYFGSGNSKSNIRNAIRSGKEAYKCHWRDATQEETEKYRLENIPQPNPQ